MSRSLQIIFIVVLVVITGLGLWYQTNIDRLTEEVRVYLEEKLSGSLQCQVKIARVKHLPLYSLSLENISVCSQDPAFTPSHIKRISATPSLYSFIFEKKAVLKITVHDLVSDKTSLNSSFRVESRRATSWKEVFDPNLITTVNIMRGLAEWNGYPMEKITGVLFIEKLQLVQGQILFSAAGKAGSLDFTRSMTLPGNFSALLKTEDFSLDGTFSLPDDVLYINRFRGSVYSVMVDLKGKISSPLTDHKTFSLNGTLRGDIGKVLRSVNSGQTPRYLAGSIGTFDAGLDVTFNERDIPSLTLEANISSEYMRIGHAEIKNLSGRISTLDKKISIPRLDFMLSGKPAYVDMSLDISNDSFPTEFTVKTTGMDIGSTLGDVVDLKNENYGPVDLDLSFKGYGSDLVKLTAFLRERAIASSAAPGETVPQVVPLIIEKEHLVATEISCALNMKTLNTQKAALEDISARLSMKNGTFDLASLEAVCFGGSARVSSQWHLASERLPFGLKLSIRGMDSVALLNIPGAKGPLNAEVSLKAYARDLADLAKKAGERSGKTEISFTDTVWNILLLLMEEKKVGDVDFAASFSLPVLHLPKADLEALSSALYLRNGELNVTSLGFRSFGGKVQLSSKWQLEDERLPFSLSADLSRIDPEAIDRSASAGNKVTGPVDISFFLKGYARELESLVERVKKNSAGTKLSPMDTVWRTFLLMSDEKRLQDIALNASLSIPRIETHKTRFDNVSAIFSLKDAALNISTLDFGAFGGILKTSSEWQLDNRRLPFSLKADIKGIRPESFSPEDTAGQKTKVTGPVNLSFAMGGFYQDLSLLAEKVKRNAAGARLSPIDTLWKSILLMIEDKEIRNVEFFGSLDLKRIDTGKTGIKDPAVKIRLQKGYLNIPSFSFGIYDSSIISGDLDMNLADPFFPFSINTRVSNIDIAKLADDPSGTKTAVKGIIDLDLSYKGNLQYLSDLSEYLRQTYAARQKPEPGKTLERLLAFLTGRKDTRYQNLSAVITSDTLKIGKLRLLRAKMNASLADGIFLIPSLTGQFYNGSLSSKLKADLNYRHVPFAMNGEIMEADFGLLMRDSDPEENNRVSGKLDGTVELRGDWTNQWSYAGKGDYYIYDANLGPMPLVTPLLGSIYSTMEKLIPSFRKIIIASSSSTFEIKNRRLSTKDLQLSGEDIYILGSGHLDFDGNLNISFENKLILSDEPEEETWQTSIRNFITAFGNTVSKVYLRGTIQKPKWECEFRMQ